MPGNASSRLKTVTPQVGQKKQSCQRPDSEDRRQRVMAPAVFIPGSEKNAPYEKALPVPRWQSTQAQA